MAEAYTITLEIRGVWLAKLLAHCAKPVVVLVHRFSPDLAERMIAGICAVIPHLIRVRAT